MSSAAEDHEKNLSGDEQNSDAEMPPLEDIEKEMNANPNNKKNIVIDKESSDEEEFSLSKNGWLDILSSGDLRKKVIKAGNSVRAQRGNRVVIRLVTRIYDDDDTTEEGTGQIISGETFDRFVMVVGDNDLHQSLDLILPLMELQEISRAIVKPRFTYGELGNKAVGIPSNTTLDLLIELLEIQTESDILPPDPGEPNAIAANESLEERLRFGNYKKIRGNFWFERAEYTLAIMCYRGALNYLDANEAELKLVDDNKEAIENKTLDKMENGKQILDIDDLIEKRAQTYNNMAVAQLKCNTPDVALKSVENSLLLRPNNVKALFRHAKILADKGDIEESIAELKKAASVDPKSEAVGLELERMNRILAKQIHDQKQMYRRMLQTKPNDLQQQPGEKSDQSKSSSTEPTVAKPASSSKSPIWSQIRWPALLSAFGAVASAVLYTYYK